MGWGARVLAGALRCRGHRDSTAARHDQFVRATARIAAHSSHAPKDSRWANLQHGQLWLHGPQWLRGDQIDAVASCMMKSLMMVRICSPLLLLLVGIGSSRCAPDNSEGSIARGASSAAPGNTSNA